MAFDKIFAIDYWHVSVRQPPRGEKEYPDRHEGRDGHAREKNISKSHM